MLSILLLDSMNERAIIANEMAGGHLGQDGRLSLSHCVKRGRSAAGGAALLLLFSTEKVYSQAYELNYY